MQSSNPLFLSYRSLERGFASRLAADLKAASVPVWIDCMDIGLGSSWDDAIAEAIEKCSGLLAVVSPAYVSSQVCRNEIARAQRLGRPILVVLLEPLARAADWPLLLERQQYVDFSSWTDSDNYRHRLDELLETINQSFTFGPATPPDPEMIYLDDLQARLEESRGVLQYVALDAAAADPAVERAADESGFDAMLELEDGGQRRATRWQDLEALLLRVRKLAILGAAGGGKTTTLRWLTLRSVLARRAQPRSTPLPVFAPLAQWRDGQSFIEYISAACPLLASVPQSLRGSDTLLLLDGLNEMGPAAASRVQALSAWIGEQNTQPLMALTCRSADFAQFGLTGFAVASLRPLEAVQIRQFASRYLLSSSARFLDQVLPSGHGSSGEPAMFADLARNPYMLSALIYLFQAAPDTPLPNNPGALFMLLAKALWAREARRRQNVQRHPFPAWNEARRHLADLARATVEGEEAEDMPLQRAEATLGTELLFAALDANLLSRYGAFVRFAHDLLRFALAAQALADLEPKTFDQWCRRHVRRGWEQMAVAWSGISKHADAFLEQSNWQDAADLVAKGFKASDSALRTPIRRALEALAVDHWRSFQPAMEALRSIGHPAVPMLIEALTNADHDLRAKIVFVLGNIGDERATPALIPLLEDREGDVSARSSDALRKIGSPEARRALAAHAVGDVSVPRPRAAVEALAKLGEFGDGTAAPALRALLSDPDRETRLAAIGALGQLRDASSADPLFAVLGDGDDETRAAALRSLASIGHPQLRLAVTRALADSESVQLAALDCVSALGRPAAVAALIDALKSPSERIRLRASDRLADTADPEAVDPLGALLDDSAVAASAARALGRINDDRAREVLRRRLDGDVSQLWVPCVEALEASGWTPESPREVVRYAAAKSSWSGALALGEASIVELRAVLERGMEPMRRGAAATLHTLGWAPRRADGEFFSFLTARADWEAEDRQHPGQRPSLSGWFEGQQLGRGPVRELVGSLLPALEAPLYGHDLEEALLHEDLLRRYVATVACGLARCAEAMPLLAANLNAPQDDPADVAFALGPVRIASAQAIAEITVNDSALTLLQHAAGDIRSGPHVYGLASAVAAIQGAARVLGVGKFFDLVPAALLGRKAMSESAEMDLWLSFPLGEQADAILTDWRLPELVKAIVEFDRSRLPSWMYSDMAMWELHQRLAVLALAVVAATSSEEDLETLARQALMRFWDLSAAPVLRELALSSVPALAEFARDEQARRDHS